MSDGHLWSKVYERAIRDDGSLFFEERLPHAVLDKIRRAMGSYAFANQYLNEIIPEEDRRFRKEWLKYYDSLPIRSYTFAFIDPAISQKDGADYTGIVVVEVNDDTTWFVKVAKRQRMTPTEIIEAVFEIHRLYKPMAIGVESVAFQKMLIYVIAEEMRKRNIVVPIKEINPGPERTKEARIMSLIPRFEYGNIYLAPSLYDLELELLQFPRSNHDDIIDALSQIEDLAFYPEKEKPDDREPGPNHPGYESWYIQNVLTKRSESQGGEW